MAEHLEEEQSESDETMSLTEEEIAWALDIKEAVREEHPEIEFVNDFWCGQLAIKFEDDLGAALECLQKMHYFRQEYKIQDSWEYGIRMIQEFVALFPEFWMAMEYHEDEGHHVMVCDCAKFHGKKVNKSERDIQVWLSAVYFSSTALSSDFEALRNGVVVLLENEGYEWKKNFDVKTFLKMITEISGVYPMQHQILKNYNTGYFMNILVSMARPLMPKDISSRYLMGCVSPMGRLDRIYMVPTVKAANQRLFQAYQEALQKRYANEAAFKL